MIKTCARCGNQFDRRGNAKFCLNCAEDRHRERVRRWQKAHPEKNREYVRRWEKAHPEKKREYNRRKRENAKRKLIREILSAKGVTRHENNRTVR